MSQLMKLREDHAQLVKIFRRLGEIVGHESPPPQIDLFDIRRVISTLLAHLKLEDWALYPILIQSPDPELSHAGKWFKEEMGGLAPSLSLIATAGRPARSMTGRITAATRATCWRRSTIA